MNTNHNPDQEFANDKTPRENQEQVNPDTYSTHPEEDREDDLEQEEEELDEADLDERRDWGDVDPAGGEAPTSPGSAV